MSLAKRETVHGKKVYRLLFLSIIFLKKLLFEEKTGKISKVTEPKRKLGSRTETEPKIYRNNVDLYFYSAFWHDVLWV